MTRLHRMRARAHDQRLPWIAITILRILHECLRPLSLVHSLTIILFGATTTFATTNTPTVPPSHYKWLSSITVAFLENQAGKDARKRFDDLDGDCLDDPDDLFADGLDRTGFLAIASPYSFCTGQPIQRVFCAHTAKCDYESYCGDVQKSFEFLTNDHEQMVAHQYRACVYGAQKHPCIICNGSHCFDECPVLGNAEFLRSHYVRFCQQIRRVAASHASSFAGPDAAFNWRDNHERPLNAIEITAGSESAYHRHYGEYEAEPDDEAQDFQ